MSSIAPAHELNGCREPRALLSSPNVRPAPPAEMLAAAAWEEVAKCVPLSVVSLMPQATDDCAGRLNQDTLAERGRGNDVISRARALPRTGASA